MNYQIVGAANSLAAPIALKMKKNLIIPQIITFADGEIEIKFNEPNKLKDNTVFIVQSTCSPVNDTLMQLLLTIFQAKNAGAKKVIAVIPYFGYARHDKGVVHQSKPEVALIAKMIEAAGADAVITVSVHSPESLAYFKVPAINIRLFDVICAHIQNQFKDLSDICLVAPDKGAQELVQAIGQQLGVGHICFTKKRIGIDATEIEAQDLTSKRKIAIIIDDIIDTGGTAINACNALIAQGFEQVYGYFIHPVFSAGAVDKIEKSAFKKVFVSDSIPSKAFGSKIEQFDISHVLVEVLNKKI